MRLIWVEIAGVIAAVALMILAIASQYLFVGSSGAYFLALLAFPAMHVARFHGLDAASFSIKGKPRLVSYDVLSPVLLAVVTFAAIPYFFALAGVLPQDTPINVLYTGALGHSGIHHGWVGWYLVFEGYLYHRVNRHAKVNFRDGELWRNALLAMGIFLFIEDYWGEEISAGVLKWPDSFRSVNSLFPFSWNTNFFIEIVIFTAIIMIFLVMNFRCKRKNDTLPS
jgi:hypothetical protein